jgi:hypothetical protein
MKISFKKVASIAVSTALVTTGLVAAPAIAATKNLTVETVFQLTSTDPARSFEQTGNMINRALYETLLTYKGGDASTQVPGIASKWSVNAGATAPEWFTPAASGPTFIGAVVGFSADKTIANTTTTVLTMDTELFDSNGFHSTSSDTSRLTIPAGYAGKYFISSQLFPSENSAGRREIRFRKNGSEIAGWNMNAFGTMEMIQFYAYVDASVADYFEVTFRQNIGSNLTLYGSSSVAGSAWCFNIQYLGA